MAEMKSAIDDLKDARVPQCLYWNVEQVADWMEDLGFPYYRSCITDNMISGRKLIHLEASHLPNIGITDFEHIKIVAKSVRDLLFLEEPNWNRSISLPPRSDIGMYLEKKAGTGKEMDGVTFTKYLLDVKDPKWRPPLSNHCLILPQS